jgi:NAD(P)-dependent dehydrogenase (short-subunit alcohol dehydrogenase family)
MRNIIITGGTSGIGKAFVDTFSSSYSFHVLSSKLASTNLSQTYVKCNLNSETDMDKFVNHIKSKNIFFSGLIHSAGVTYPQNEKISYDDWEETLKINFFSLSYLMNGLKDNMKNNSSVVLLSSIGGQLGFEGNPSYQISKASLIQFTKSLAVDLQPNIRVNCIAPGYIMTDMTKKSFEDMEMNKKIKDKTLLNRWGNANEVAEVINFLISSRSSYINGQTINVDGGWSVKGL